VKVSSPREDQERLSIVNAIEKLAVAGERAGFTIEQMIELLNEGLTVESLIGLVLWRLDVQSAVPIPLSAGWVIRRENA
jgi:hypothetical protein